MCFYFPQEIGNEWYGFGFLDCEVVWELEFTLAIVTIAFFQFYRWKFFKNLGHKGKFPKIKKINSM